MTKREYCESHECVAVYSGVGGVEIHGIEYGIEDYVYCVSNAWHGTKRYHRAKIYYNGDNAYFMLRGYKVPFSECFR